MSKTRTITLTDRPPVTIDEDKWPLIASVSDKEYDNQYEFQANRISKWFFAVRQHDDGRVIVYATYSYDTAWQGARCYAAKHGDLLPAGTDSAGIVASINDVARRMEAAECNGEDSGRWATLAADCIADLPAETLD